MKNKLKKQVSFWVLSILVCAQDYTDALRWGTFQPYGSARAFGMGGALAALGPDWINTMVNPAGLSLYERADLFSSFQLIMKSSSINYLGATSQGIAPNFNFNNFGIIGPIQNVSFKLVWAFGYSRTDHYFTNIPINVKNSTSTILDDFLKTIEDNSINNPQKLLSDPKYATTLKLAWNTFLLDTFTDVNGKIKFYHPFFIKDLEQNISITTKGMKREWLFSLANLIDDRFGWGLTLSYVDIDFAATIIHTEKSNNDTNPIAKFTYTRDMVSNGGGFQFRLGFLIKPTPQFKIGGYFHAPLIALFEDKWNAKMESSFTDQSNYYDIAHNEGFVRNYVFYGPLIVGAQLGGSILDKIALGADYSYHILNLAKFTSADYSYSYENSRITEYLKPVHNFKFGVEGIITPNFYIRGGYFFRSSPTGSNAPKISNKHGFFAGFRFTADIFYFDFGSGFETFTYDYYPYRRDIAPKATIQTNLFTFMVTFGFRSM